MPPKPVPTLTDTLNRLIVLAVLGLFAVDDRYDPKPIAEAVNGLSAALAKREDAVATELKEIRLSLAVAIERIGNLETQRRRRDMK